MREIPTSQGPSESFGLRHSAVKNRAFWQDRGLSSRWEIKCQTLRAKDSVDQRHPQVKLSWWCQVNSKVGNSILFLGVVQMFFIFGDDGAH